MKTNRHCPNYPCIFDNPPNLLGRVTPKGVDDYASLDEVLERRFRRSWGAGGEPIVDEQNAWSFPDLVVVDGGKGQLAAATKGMARANVHPYMGVYKNIKSVQDMIVSDMISQNTSARANSTRLKTGEWRTVPLCALAKNKEDVFVHGESSAVNDSSDTPALLLLRAIRDESHRFALNAHRKRRASQAGFRRERKREHIE
eukprot:scaffold92720_cov59-Attheya_sp.AAC.2